MTAGKPNFLELPPPTSGVPTSLAHGVRPNVPGGGNPIVAGTDVSETPSEIFRECHWCSIYSCPVAEAAARSSSVPRPARRPFTVPHGNGSRSLSRMGNCQWLI